MAALRGSEGSDASAETNHQCPCCRPGFGIQRPRESRRVQSAAAASEGIEAKVRERILRCWMYDLDSLQDGRSAAKLSLTLCEAF